MEGKKTLKSNRIPSWQLAEPSTGPNDQLQDSHEKPLQTVSPSRDLLVGQAATFLLDEDVRDAPLERKRSFLQSKGLSIDEIDRLLQASVGESPSNARAEGKTQIPEVKSRRLLVPKSIIAYVQGSLF